MVQLLSLDCKTRIDMSITAKTTLIAAGLAFAVNNGCVLLLMGLGMIDQWFFVLPLIMAAQKIQPTWLCLSLQYAFGFLQFFILFWITVRMMYGRRAA